MNKQQEIILTNTINYLETLDEESLQTRLYDVDSDTYVTVRDILTNLREVLG